MKEKTIEEIRKSIREKYVNYIRTSNELFSLLNEINEIIPKTLLEADEILGIAESAIKLKENLDMPKKEIKEELKEELEVPKPEE